MKVWNIWKIAFITLFSILLLLISAGYIFLYNLSNTGELFESPPERVNLTGPKFNVTTTKGDLNLWLEREMQKEQTGNDVPFQLYLDSYVHFKTVLPIFGLTIPLEMTLEPYVSEGGNLELYERSFQISDFSLPSQRIFQLIQTTVELPPWIYIYPDEQKFYLDLGGISEDIQIYIKSFNLEEDDLQFIITF
ncbi:uncharacterized protein YpmS [Evansella vedderi]|uniref:Uncharacterized protein YpmS n=1 Tax=Evansella vedderi TaxID=38282 RepID=A0ABT9ZU55_9BACI|nr:YpmS family protein [Evansella vedderi]MDQ0254216.1 uncharacterized protein YpmS [Evansella vedderi]